MPYRTTPQVEQRKAVVRGRIVAAARKLFAEQGYEASSVQQIVREAGTSVGNFYFYFANKEAVLQAVTEQFAEEVTHAVDDAVSRAPSGAAQLAALSYASTRALLRDLALARHILVPILEQLAQRTRQLLAANPKLLRGGVDVNMAALAWQGSQAQVLGAAIAGEIE